VAHVGQGGYRTAFRQKAVDRLKAGEDPDEVAQELGVHRRTLYRWQRQLDPVTQAKPKPPCVEGQLQHQVQRLSQLLAEKTLEVDFFRSALQKVEARRQRNSGSGAKASTIKSEK